jgi:hypothetical protein
MPETAMTLILMMGGAMAVFYWGMVVLDRLTWHPPLIVLDLGTTRRVPPAQTISYPDAA